MTTRNCLYMRSLIVYNNDPQHSSIPERWSEWELLDYNFPDDKIEEKLNWWRELNDEAVKARGRGATKEFEHRVERI